MCAVVHVVKNRMACNYVSFGGEMIHVFVTVGENMGRLRLDLFTESEIAVVECDYLGDD